MLLLLRQTSSYRDQYTRRTFEIPACGAFLLAERTPVMQQLYEEGKEAEYFETPEEFVEKCKYYLKHENKRRQISKAGMIKALTAGYDVNSRMRQWVNDIKDWMEMSKEE
ncbi:MAG: glycosyltransferase family 1 protein [Lentisphaerae bacterium]|nr:glycosyltransferase family 1 protein [Lentisphaerota bacterium]MCP4100565.1 glycosyltransferase family 1 protein [Lentisphaerota bacterium]